MLADEDVDVAARCPACELGEALAALVHEPLEVEHLLAASAPEGPLDDVRVPAGLQVDEQRHEGVRTAAPRTRPPEGRRDLDAADGLGLQRGPRAPPDEAAGLAANGALERRLPALAEAELDDVLPAARAAEHQLVAKKRELVGLFAL